MSVRVQDPARQELAAAAVERLLATSHGVLLVKDLCQLLDPDPSARVIIHFVDALPVNANDHDGCFRPAKARAEVYEVFIRNYQPLGDNEQRIDLFGVYPGNTMCDIVFWYIEPESSMAHTLFHELLHVWFVNRYEGEQRRYPTGHGELRRCEIDEEFLEQLQEHARELDELEGRRPDLLPHDPPAAGEDAGP